MLARFRNQDFLSMNFSLPTIKADKQTALLSIEPCSKQKTEDRANNPQNVTKYTKIVSDDPVGQSSA